jgi:hypothetical protein
MEDATVTDAEFAARLAELVAGLRQTKAPTSMTSTPEGLPRACASERIEPLTDGRLEFTGQPRYAFTFGAGRARSPGWWS